MKKSVSLLLIAIIGQFQASSALEKVSDGLSEEFMNRVVKAAAASHLAKENDANIMLRQFSSQKQVIPYNETDNPGIDDAILIRDQGQCFVAFQATTDYLKDILQNVNLLSEKVCRGNDCCRFREGFYNGWATSYKDKLMNDVTSCVQEECDENSSEPCLIIAGHSQGGSVATVASVELSTITSSYEVITFAAAPSLMTSPDKCKAVDYEKHYRFGKGLFKSGMTGGRSGLVFDKVSFLGPDGIIPFADTYPIGWFLMLSSESDDSVAYIGFNYDETLNPWDHVNVLGHAHKMFIEKGKDYENTGYFQIVRDIRDTASYPVPVNGFSDGVHCSKKAYGEMLCKSGKCKPRDFTGRRPRCVPS